MMILNLLLLALFIYFFIPGIKTAFTFVYLYIERQLSQDLMDNQPTSWMAYLKLGLLEYALLVSQLPLFPWRWKRSQPLHSSSKAIVFLHGYMRTPTDWLWLQKQLEQRCQYPIFCLDVKPSMGTIQTISENIAQEIKQLAETHQIESFILIGHSMGGLVASYCSEYLDPSQRIESVIAIGAPYAGTKMACLGWGPNAQQMRPHSKFLEDLRERISQSTRRHCQIATPFDNMIFPWRSCFLTSSSMDDQCIVPHTSHLGLLISPVTLNQIIDWILQKPDASEHPHKIHEHLHVHVVHKKNHFQH